MVTDTAAPLGTGFVRATSLEELRHRGVVTVTGLPGGPRHGIAVFLHEDRAYAVDNRCPHMGFPLSRGSCKDGVLTCHWHYARFDLETGGTFDQWAGEVEVYPVALRDNQVWVDLGVTADTDERREAERRQWLRRLDDGLERNIPLVQAKAVLKLLDVGVPAADIARRVAAYALRYGSRRNPQGWGDGLTILTAMANLLEEASPEDRALALYHGARRAGEDTSSRMERVELEPLATERVPVERLKAWFRHFIEVRDTDAAERALRTAISNEATPAQLVDMLVAAATDHYYRDASHLVDALAKQCELLDLLGWDQAPLVLPSIVQQLAVSSREEEGSAWHHPVDLVAIVERAAAELPDLVDAGREPAGACDPRLVEAVLGDDPQASAGTVMEAFRSGAALADVALALAFASALRLARFPTTNEFADWDTVLHHFSYCASLAQLARRAPSVELARGVLHGAMVLYLGRFLNVPAARLPGEARLAELPAEQPELIDGLLALLDEQAQVDRAGAVVYRYLTLGHDPGPIKQALARAVLREDATFHDYQVIDEALRLAGELQSGGHMEEARQVLVGVARWQAAHTPTRRAVTQTYTIALRLHRGEAVHEDRAAG